MATPWATLKRAAAEIYCGPATLLASQLRAEGVYGGRPPRLNRAAAGAAWPPEPPARGDTGRTPGTVPCKPVPHESGGRGARPRPRGRSPRERRRPNQAGPRSCSPRCPSPRRPRRRSTPLTFPATRPSRTMPNLKSVMAGPALSAGGAAPSGGSRPGRAGARPRHSGSGRGRGQAGRAAGGRGWAGLGPPPPPRARRTCHAPPPPPRAHQRAEPRAGRDRDTPPTGGNRPIVGRALRRPWRAVASRPIGMGKGRRRSGKKTKCGGRGEPGAAPARRPAQRQFRGKLCARCGGWGGRRV